MLMGWCSGHNHVQDKLSSGEKRKFLALRARRHQDETLHWDSQGFFYYPLWGTLDPEHVCQPIRSPLYLQYVWPVSLGLAPLKWSSSSFDAAHGCITILVLSVFYWPSHSGPQELLTVMPNRWTLILAELPLHRNAGLEIFVLFLHF